jgi:hypothetical protein
MRRSALLLIAASLFATSTARPDVRTDYIRLGVSSVECPHGAGYELRQVFESADGGLDYATSLYQVPTGWVLEITDISFHESPSERCEKTVRLTVQNRHAPSRAHEAFSATLGTLTAARSDAPTSPSCPREQGGGRDSRHWSFSTGPLVSPAARLCWQQPSQALRTHEITIRGRLHPTDTGLVGIAPLPLEP